MGETTCIGPNCQGHPHSPECRAEYARSLQSTRSEAMELDEEVYVAHAIAYLNGLETKAAKEMADGLLRFLNSHYRLVAQIESKWQPIETAPRDGFPILIATSNNAGEAWYVKSEEGWWWANMDPSDPYDGQAFGATHWMPLPEPPGGDDEHSD